MTLFNYLSTSALTLLGAAQLFAQTAAKSNLTEPACAITIGEQVYCNTDGKIYRNLCFAIKANIMNSYPGACVRVPDGSTIPRVAMPNGTDQAQAISVPTRPDYACLDVYRPVCANGVTYSNACYASRAGATSWTEGACGSLSTAYNAAPSTTVSTTTSDAITVDCLYDPTVRIYCSSTGLYYRDACAARKAGATGCYPVSNPDVPRVAMPTNETQTTISSLSPIDETECERTVNENVYCIKGGHFDNMCLANRAGAVACVWVGDGSSMPRVAMPTDETQTIEAARRPDYACLDVYRPVCANGVTYGNACYASLAGETSWTEGACGSDAFAARNQRSASHFSNDYSVTVYPNPTNNIMNVQIQDAAAQSIRLYNIAGQLVREQQNINANQVEISVADLANGIYTISVITEKGTRNERVQVQH